MSSLSIGTITELRARRGVLEVELSALTALLDQVDAAPRPSLARAPARRTSGHGRSLGACAAAVVAFLEKQEHRAADSAVVRREIGKQLGAGGDAKAVSNALSRLKAKGQVTRKGTMWTLRAGS